MTKRIDARGRTTQVRETSGADGTISLSTAPYARGFYIVNVHSDRHRGSVAVVLRQGK